MSLQHARYVPRTLRLDAAPPLVVVAELPDAIPVTEKLPSVDEAWLGLCMSDYLQQASEVGRNLLFLGGLYRTVLSRGFERR